MCSKSRLALLVALALALAFCAYSVRQEGDELQYLIAAPAPPAEKQQDEDGEETQPPEKPELVKLLEKLEGLAEDWQSAISRYTVYGVLPGAQLTADSGASSSARLTGAHGAQDAPLITGRRIYPDEMTRGDAVMLLGEQLALALFRVGDPLDRIVTFNNTQYRVVGILRDARGAGDGEQNKAVVPLLSLTKVQLSALMVSALPVGGSGANAAFKAAMDAWQPGGDLYSLQKEKTRALLPVRALACVIVMLLCYRLGKRLFALAKRAFLRLKERLRDVYASKLVPKAALLLLAFAAGFAALIFVGAKALEFFIDPVYTFPEWVPAVPVEWTEIAKTFWQNREDGARLVQLRSPEMLRLRFFGGVTAFLSAMEAIVLAGARRRAKKE